MPPSATWPAHNEASATICKPCEGARRRIAGSLMFCALISLKLARQSQQLQTLAKFQDHF